MAIRSYSDPIVWQRSMDLVVEIYAITAQLPDEEKLGLRSQIRRAACSVPMNVAEGYGRGTRRDHANFVSMARGSLLEVETGLVIAERLGMLNAESLKGIRISSNEIERMLTRPRTGLAGVTSSAKDQSPLNLVPGTLKLSQSDLVKV